MRPAAMGKRTLAILVTHPIQYQAPLFRALARNGQLDVTVYFCHRPTPEQQGAGFGVAFEWDINLTNGYRHVWLTNVSRKPSLVTFGGCDTPEIAAIIEQKNFDAFIVQGWHCKSYWQAIRACRRKGTPLLVRGDSQLPADKWTLKRALKKCVYPLFMRRFATCLPYGERSDEYFRYYGARRTEISPHFVDNRWFADKADAEKASGNIRRRGWGIGDQDFVFLFVGKFEEKKRPLDPLRAMALLPSPFKRSSVLVMVGDGTMRPLCENLSRELDINAVFTGFLNQTEMPRAYAAADCLVLPSDARETWGLVVNEAMACGLPALVSTAAGCVPDLIIEDETGYSFHCGKVEELSRLMALFAGNPERARSLGQNAATRIERYNVDQAARIIIDTVHELAQQ
jgi:glycosyltransferase involved in cell wall biosynthesis